MTMSLLRQHVGVTLTAIRLCVVLRYASDNVPCHDVDYLAHDANSQLLSYMLPFANYCVFSLCLLPLAGESRFLAGTMQV